MKQITLQDLLDMVQKADLNLTVDLREMDKDIKLTEQGVDSLDMASFLFEVEDYFQVNIEDEEISNNEWDTLNKIINKLNQSASK